MDEATCISLCRLLFDNAATQQRWGRDTRFLLSKRSVVAVRPRACVKVGRRSQCEWGFTLQTE